ncbi:N/A [soil metagenome]
MTPQPTAIRVLVADDEPDLRLLLRMQLRRHPSIEFAGEAADGAEAVEMAVREGVDAVVMDLLMPGTSGFEAIGRLREEAPSIGIVAYTAVAGDFVREEIARQGVELVLKSGNVEPLVAALLRSVSQTAG